MAAVHVDGRGWPPAGGGRGWVDQKRVHKVPGLGQPFYLHRYIHAPRAVLLHRPQDRSVNLTFDRLRGA